jgi:hypothetical protein
VETEAYRLGPTWMVGRRLMLEIYMLYSVFAVSCVSSFASGSAFLVRHHDVTRSNWSRFCIYGQDIVTTMSSLTSVSMFYLSLGW